MIALTKLRESGRTVQLLDGDVLINPPPPDKWIPRLIEVKPDIVKALKAEQLSVNKLTPDEESRIRTWMQSLGETSKPMMDEYINKCRIDPDARVYFLKRCEELSQEVKCQYCQHFIKDDIGGGGGIGECRIEAPASINKLLWFNTLMTCTDYVQS